MVRTNPTGLLAFAVPLSRDVRLLLRESPGGLTKIGGHTADQMTANTHRSVLQYHHRRIAQVSATEVWNWHAQGRPRLVFPSKQHLIPSGAIATHHEGSESTSANCQRSVHASTAKDTPTAFNTACPTRANIELSFRPLATGCVRGGKLYNTPKQVRYRLELHEQSHTQHMLS